MSLQAPTEEAMLNNVFHQSSFTKFSSNQITNYVSLNDDKLNHNVSWFFLFLTCFTALGKLSTVTLCLTDMPPLGRRRLQNPGEYRFLSVLYSLWLDCPKIMLLLCLFKAEASLKLNASHTMALPVVEFSSEGYKIRVFA